MDYPKNTPECLSHLFPDANPQSDWRVLTVGDGEIIFEFWNDALGEKPTLELLNAVSVEAKKTAKFRWIRKKRNNLLRDTDWMAASDLTMSTAWKKYRQELRDLPGSNVDPDHIKWPTKPV